MKLIFVILVGIFVFFYLIRYLENRSIFFPMREVSMTPLDTGIAFEDVYFKASDGLRLNGWFIKNPNSRATLLWFHGNGGNIGHRLDKIGVFHSLNVNIFIFDYRGYGKSEGYPTEKGLYLDSQAAYDYVLGRGDVDKDKIIIYGESLGGAAAIDLATKKPIACLIADSAFSSAADMANVIYPFVPSIFLATKMNSVFKVKKINAPKLFIHSISDEIIPFKLGKKLFDSAAEPKQFIEIKGGHNTNYIDSRELWFNSVKNFLASLNLI